MSSALDLKKLINSVEKRLSRAISPEAMGMIGRFVVAEIKSRSRDGYGVNADNSPFRFPPLSAKYIAQRRKGRLSPFTSPGMSNITRTGQLLASLRYTVNTGKAVIRPVGTHTPSGISNEDLARFVTNNNRRFMGLTKVQIERLADFIAEKIL